MPKVLPVERWQALMEEAAAEMVKWRRRHGRATFQEIEEEVDESLAGMRAQILRDMVLASERADIRGLSKEERPPCPLCGGAVWSEGMRERRLTTHHEQVIELSRSYASCPECGIGFFPPGCIFSIFRGMTLQTKR